jgi:beta-galactosidase
VWDGNWHLVAGTYDGASVRLYVDGAQIGAGTPTSLVIGYTGLDHTNFDIGAYRGSTCTLGFKGAIDEIRLFNRALAASEILSIFQQTP